MTCKSPALPADLDVVVHKIRVLRDYTVRTGFRTTRSEKEILARLSADDLAVVLMELENKTDDDGTHSR